MTQFVQIKINGRTRLVAVQKDNPKHGSSCSACSFSPFDPNKDADTVATEVLTAQRKEAEPKVDPQDPDWYGLGYI